MNRTPNPHQVARALRDAADALDKHGPDALKAAPVLATRGFSGGAGDGTGRRGPDTSDPTGNAAQRGRDQWTGIDDKLHRWLTVAYTISTGGCHLLSQITGHADPTSTDRKNRHPGSGRCNACGRDVPGTANDRLRSGWCSGCKRAYERAGFPDRAAFERTRYAEKNPPITVTIDPSDLLAEWEHGNTTPDVEGLDTEASSV